MKDRVPEAVSFDGAELLWIDAILLVPAIFGIMFLPDVLRAIVLSVVVALLAAYFLLYAWARVHPTSFGAHLLELMHIGPSRPTRV
jgi:hypothetical protein